MRRIIVSLTTLIAAVVAMAAASTAPAFAVVINPGPDGSGNVTPGSINHPGMATWEIALIVAAAVVAVFVVITVLTTIRRRSALRPAAG